MPALDLMPTRKALVRIGRASRRNGGSDGFERRLSLHSLLEEAIGLLPTEASVRLTVNLGNSVPLASQVGIPELATPCAGGWVLLSGW